MPTSKHTVHRSTGGTLTRQEKKLPEALQLWKQLLDANGIKGVLRKTDSRYWEIRRVYNEELDELRAGNR